MIVPKQTYIIPFKEKIRSLGPKEICENRYRCAVDVLRGGDGGEHGKILYKTILQKKTLGMDKLTILDIGTARGFSSIIMARALIDTGLDGKVYTVDIIDHHKKLCWHVQKQKDDEPLAEINITRFQIWNKWFKNESVKILPMTEKSLNVLEKWKYGMIDIAFLDGCHTYKSVKNELELLHPLLNRGGICILDDYHLGLNTIQIPFVNFLFRIVRKITGKNILSNFDFFIVKQKFFGIKKAVYEFMNQYHDQYTFEIIMMPSRIEGRQNDDYSLAVIKKIKN